MKNKSELVVGLDIGTTKILCLVGRQNEHNKLEILGVGKAESLGVKRGEVQNIRDTVDSIKKAVAMASEESKVNIRTVNVGIAGIHIRSMQQHGMMMRPEFKKEIDETDVNDLIDRMKKMQMQPGYEIIHCLPQEFIVDERIGVKDPVGMFGSKLEANFHVITGHISAAQVIYHCIEKAGLNISDLILEPLASSDSVLTEEEKEAGVVLVDIGGGTTDIAIFHDGIIRHTAVLPFGGNIITDDIRMGCNVLQRDAEKLKVNHGNALASMVNENNFVSIPGLKNRQPREISLKNLAFIIQARMKEIIAMVNREIIASGYERKLIGGIVLTGGGAMLKNLKSLFELETGFDVRIGSPAEFLAKNDRALHHPMNATGVGLVLQGINNKRLVMTAQTSEVATEDTSIAGKQKKDPIRGPFFSKIMTSLSKTTANIKDFVGNVMTDEDDEFKDR
jgi:cell division protein FtsA